MTKLVERIVSPKKRIKISSAKAKARRLQNWVAGKVSKITGIDCGKDCMIEGREMGQSGVDLKLYGPAREKFPFSVECKYQETWSLPAFIKDAKDNKEKGTDWLLFIKKNHYEEIIVMDAEAFFDIYDTFLKMLFGKDHKLITKE